MLKKDLIDVTFVITNRCNLRCLWCFENDILSKKEELSAKETISVFQKLKGLKSINLSGGEIFLRKDIGEILNAALEIFPKVHLITNGIKIPVFLIPFFRKHNISFSISIDGPKDIHETIRGKNTFGPAIKSIELLRKNGLYVNMQATISKINQEYVENIIKIGKRLQVNRISFIKLKGIGAGANCKGLILNIDETKKINEKLYALTRKEKDVYIMMKDSFINTLDTDLIRKAKELGPQYICGGCRAGIEMLYISYKGEIYPCPFLRISLGNIFKDDIWNIWLNSPVLQNLRNKEKYSKCSKCEYWQVCRGCRAESLRVSGDYLAPDPYCWK